MEEKKKKKEKKKKGSGLKLFGKILLGILIFLLLLLLFIRSPWGQGIITDQLVSYISDKTNTEVQVEKLFITFSGDISLQGVYLEDKNGDTLVYSRDLEADIPLLPILKGQGISIDNLEWSGVVANISRKDTVQGFNFQFLMDALVPSDSTATTTTPADTTASGSAFSLGDLDLKDFRINYNDGVSGIDTKVKLGSLKVEMQEFNMDSMVFKIGDASLENTRFSYQQTKPFPDEPPKEETPAPYFSVENLSIDDVVANYESIPDGLFTDLYIDDFLLKLPKADMATQEVHVEMLGLRSSEIIFKTQTAETEKTADTLTASTPFEWPEWQIKLDEISLINNRFTQITNDATPKKGVLNPNALALRDLTFKAHDIAFQPKDVELHVEELHFNEASGLDLKQATFDLALTDKNLRLKDLDIALNGNNLEGRLLTGYSSFSAFMEKPENAEVDLDLPIFNLDVKDLFLIQPDLKKNEYISALSKKPLSGELHAEGKLSAIELTDTRISWGSTTRLSAEGRIINAMEPEKLQFDFPQFSMNSTRNDLQNFVKEQDLGIQLPQKLSLTGSFNGTPEDISVDAVLRSSAGKLAVNGKFVTAPGIAFDADIQATQLELGQLLQNPQLGPISLSLSTSGEGAEINTLDAVVESTVSSFTYNNYEFQGIELYGEIEKGEGFANVDYKDENLNMKLGSFVELDSVAPTAAIRLNLIGADLEALGLSPRPINTALDLRANFEGNAESFNVTAHITDGVAVYANESYLLGEVELLAHVRPDTTSMDIDNRMLQLRLRSNTDPNGFMGALTRHYDRYFSTSFSEDTITDPVNLELRAQVSPAPIMEQVLLPQLEEMDTIHVAVDFNEKERSLAANINLPYAQYMGIEVDSLRFNLDSDREKLAFDFGLKNLNAGPLDIKETILKGDLKNETLTLDFTSNYGDKQLVHSTSEITRKNDILRYHIFPEDFVLNAADWNIDPQNEVVITDDSWTFNNFRLTRNKQLFRIGNDIEGVQKEHIGLHFENFTLAALLSYFNPEEVLASGRMNGNFIIEEPFGSTGLLADLDVREFAVMDVPLGLLTLNAEAIGRDRYNLDLAIKDGNADLDLTGSYIADAEAANLDLQLDLNRISMKVVEGFSQGAIRNSDGYFRGNISVTGTTAEPAYEGELRFEQAGFTVATLNAPFVFPDETLRLDNKGFYLDDFEIRDMNGNSLFIDGSLLTETITNPEFDLSFRTQNFTALNSTEEDNDLFYGKATFDATGSLTGNLDLPKVELELSVDEETNMTYIIPEASLAMEEREGVVIFVNREDPDRILTRNQDEGEAVAFSGILLNSYIEVQKGATFKVVLNEDTGDNFLATGSGDILFDIYPNGRTTMSGRYEISDGHYEMSLYNLVTRKFDLMQGSSIVWAGDPMDADLNITAIYEVETSASALMAPQLTGVDMDVRNRYRQELPFLVYLKIGGEIAQPKLSFGLDMPEDEQGAIGGQVYGRVQQINQQENELNKQVFSLLVLNRFFPDSGSDGASGGTLAFARDNLNDALSDQLNIFSDKLLGETGIDLNFGLDSYTDYQGASPQERTQLDITAQKSLLNDRLIVSVGSEVDLQGSSQVEESSPVIGNVSLEYLLTENGRFRLKAFRKKSFENVIDGQIIISGLALIFTQDFNKFRELWSQIVNEEKQNQKKEK